MSKAQEKASAIRHDMPWRFDPRIDYDLNGNKVGDGFNIWDKFDNLIAEGPYTEIGKLMITAPTLKAENEKLKALNAEMLAALKECLDLGLSTLDPSLRTSRQAKLAIAKAEKTMNEVEEKNGS